MKWTFILFSMLFSAMANGQVLQWDPPAETVTGQPINPADLIYSLYNTNGKGGSKFRFAVDVDSNSIDLSFMPLGCYTFRITASFIVNRDLISNPSNEIYTCIEMLGPGGTRSTAPLEPEIYIVE